MKYPTELQLLEFFETVPIIQDDIYSYSVCDDNKIELTLSFNVMEDSLQTYLKYAGRVFAVVCQEGMTRFWIDSDVLFAEFLYEQVRISVDVHIRPHIRIEWSGLQRY